MQNSICVIFIPLFLCILLTAILTSSPSIELWNSVDSSCFTISDSVMASNMRYKRGKRLLQRNDGESLNHEAQIQEANNGEIFCAMTAQTDSGGISTDAMHQRRSKRARRVPEAAVTEKNYSSEHLNRRFQTAEQNNTLLLNESSVHYENLDVSNTDDCSRSFGQASYQKSRKGLIMKYQDSGDNIHVCNYCNANFWSGEALKQSSSNAPLIYTNCCKKGQIKIELSKQAPNLLQQLLDPNNGSNSKVFRQNIRIYNSMFSFTSMGATIDKTINTGLGPYVFKISGQVHHLMGSVLPSTGECPKYAQLYIYDTKNEISNRINAIDPTHVNTNIKPNIVEGLIKMFDENNDLVKEFRTMRNKFETQSLPSLNLTILDRQPADSKQYEPPVSEEISGLIVGDIGEYDSNRDIIIESNNRNLQRVSKVQLELIK
ncbi:uncharacterized protein LOC133716283 [Rosa rugosa]|uniref:uncharacterized protein LOC133716283 n=1 Tax=Rosa rugosa TaxID=74645 RepID=UPI002B408014|nr:uncharacterized protein LOC133716283 [Rosa rugosa]